MDYLFENFTFPPDQSFTIRSEHIEPKKYTHLKCHVNFEIALIENAAGKRFIGDHIEDFKGSDLVMIGSYVPHCWQFYKEVDPKVLPHAFVVHFFPDFLGKELLTKPEAIHLSYLFDNASKGIRFSGPTVAEARMLMQHMLFSKGLQRVALMLQLLDILSQSKHQKVLATPGFCSVENSRDADRINCVYDYIFQNFREEIVLSKVAALLHMTPAAFCRYFKLKTNRTLIDFVKEIRIGYAAKLLIDGRHNITEACYNSGHNNLSNFNKHFKELKGLTPRDFLKQYQEAVA
ncbi:MAG: AraC family transcriptional regulator [Puia sp.]|nr:AraC family transcriptional regulator [Puia sp.]